MYCRVTMFSKYLIAINLEKSYNFYSHKPSKEDKDIE